jgi:hypothetical protein
MTKVEGGGVPPGTQLNGIYEIDQRVAKGGMGEVYIGHNIQTGDKVAIKMILPELAHNQTILDLFRKEASTLNRLYHEAIVRYYVFSVDPDLDRPYLAMEYAAGPSLVDRLRDRPLTDHELDVLRHRIASGLHAAHKLGVYHRDISPDNVILVDGSVENAKIIDFGIAKSTSAEGTLIGGGFAGKLNYVSPEQLGLAGAEVTGKSDIYSLGLVLAEAAIGHPLPMGGTQVEVLEKRRAVPDLAEVPERLRPLIEWMLRPDPADRPDDMQTVAEWGQPVREPTAPPDVAASAPPARAAAGAGLPKKRGFPWLTAGALAVAAAAGAVYYVTQIDEPSTPGPVPIPSLTSGPTTVALSAPETGEISAKRGEVGHTYKWASPAFSYSGAPTELTITLDGALPSGLEFEQGDDGAGVVFGIPEQSGETRFRIRAEAPGGQQAELAALLVVDPAQTGTAPAVSTAMPSTLTSPSAGTDGGDTISLAAGGDTVGAATEPAQPAASGGDGGGGTALTGLPVTGGQGDPGLAATEPTVSVDVPSLTPAGSGAGTGAVAVGGPSGGTPAGGADPSALPSVGSGTGGESALSGSPIVDGQADPAAAATEPTVNIDVPSLTPLDQTPAAGGIDVDPLQLPKTGAGAAPPSTLGQPAAGTGDSAIVVSLPPSENQPPKILDHILAPIDGSRGEALDLALGRFDDEDGAGALQIRQEGRLPNGVEFVGTGGEARLRGRPAESGNFSIKVVATDPQGLIASFPVELSIRAPGAFRDLREYITGYDGGDCFLSRPLELSERQARIEVFVAEAEPLFRFDGDFKRDRGFEASIEGRLITPAQCGLMHALDQVGPHALDNRLQFRIDKDQLKSGETLSGRVSGGSGARLFLYDSSGGITDLAPYTSEGTQGTSFRLPLQADGPQVLVAAIPEAASGLGPSAGLEQLLGAAQQGKAALALGYIVVER